MTKGSKQLQGTQNKAELQKCVVRTLVVAFNANQMAWDIIYISIFVRYEMFCLNKYLLFTRHEHYLCFSLLIQHNVWAQSITSDILLFGALFNCTLLFLLSGN